MLGVRPIRFAWLLVLLSLLASGASGQIAPLKTWYLAEGTTWAPFEEFILIANPGATAVDARVRFLRPPVLVAGVWQKPDEIVHTYSLLPTSRTTLRLREVPEFVSALTNVSIVVDCLEPGKTTACTGDGIVVERSMYWPRSSGGTAATWLAGHNSMGLNFAATKWYLAEGATSVFDEFILLANPSAATARVALTFQGQGASRTTQTIWRDVPAGTRVNVEPRGLAELPEDLRYTSFAVEITADQPILVERAMYWPTLASGPGTTWRGGHEGGAIPALGSIWNFAEGFTGFSPSGQRFDTYLLIDNADPARPANVVITYYLDSSTGCSVTPVDTCTIEEHVTIGSQTRFTRWANDVPGLAVTSFGIKVSSDVPVVAERAMYWGTQPANPAQWSSLNWVEGHASAGVPQESTKWGFAEGTAENGFTTYFLLRNSTSTATDLKFTYVLEDGTGKTATHLLKAHSRLTVSTVDPDFPPELRGRRFATFVESTPASGPPVEFVAERAVYWGYSSWLGGHASAGIPWPGSAVVGQPAAPAGSPAPAVTSIAPSLGPATGGTSVTIVGSGFSWPSVTIGGVAASSVVTPLGDSTTITAVTGAHAAGLVDVVVTNRDGKKATLTTGFMYVTPPSDAPRVDGINPDVGWSLGRTQVTITGANFRSGATVWMGGKLATGVFVLDSTTIAATAPAHAAGQVEVSVTNPTFQTGTKTNAFTYQAPGPDYLAFGDSITAGVVADYVGYFPDLGGWLAHVSYPAPYPATLAGLIPRLAVYNAGVPGETSTTGAARLPSTLKPYHGVVVILEGTNDASGIQAGGDNTVQAIVNNLRSMVADARNQGKRVVLATLPPSVFIQAEPPNPVADYWAAEPLQISLANDGIRQLAADLAADPYYADAFVFVDIWAVAFGGNSPDTSLLSADGLHPSVAGYNRIAVTIFNALPASWK